MELTNVDESGYEQLYKLVSVNLCPNTVGQVAAQVMTNPPREGDPSHPLYNEEYTKSFQSLTRRAKLLSDTLDKIPGMSCQRVKGAMYAFPTVNIPPRAAEEAKARGLAPDAFYCFNLLESTGICVVPGSGFGQQPGTFHFRTTLLPPENELEQVVNRMATFHEGFIKKWS